MKAKIQDQRILQYEATIDRDFGVNSISSDNQKAERNNIIIGPNFIIASELLPRLAKSHHPPAIVNNKVHIMANFSTLILCSEITLSA